MISLDNIVYILRQEADAVRRDIQEHYALTERARRHKERLVRLLENAIENLEAYIHERSRPMVPVYDLAGPDPELATAAPTKAPQAPESGLL